eukprot:scaffold176121_cov31-Attheya_sp.AAC.1
MLGYGRYVTATFPIGMRLLHDGCGDDRRGCWDAAFGWSSEFDSSSSGLLLHDNDSLDGPCNN